MYLWNNNFCFRGTFRFSSSECTLHTAIKDAIAVLELQSRAAPLLIDCSVQCPIGTRNPEATVHCTYTYGYIARWCHFTCILQDDVILPGTVHTASQWWCRTCAEARPNRHIRGRWLGGEHQTSQWPQDGPADPAPEVGGERRWFVCW